MRKYAVVLLSIALCLGLLACGSPGGGTSEDPLETDSLTFGHMNDTSGTDWSMAADVGGGETVVLTAMVKNSYGDPVVGRKVTFSIAANQSGATINRGTANTDATGEATILYRSGTKAGLDVVRAKISNGASGDFNATVSPEAAGLQAVLNSSLTTLSAGQNSILSATVTDESGNPVSGQRVQFSMMMNKSVTAKITVPGVLVGTTTFTDAGGRAVAIYTAGSPPTGSVDDVVQVVVDDSSGHLVASSAAIITVMPASAATSLTIGVTAAATTLNAGDRTVVTATVSDSTGSPVRGVTVAFSFPDGSGVSSESAATLAPVSVQTDAIGQAVTVYTAGGLHSTTGVQDAVWAKTTGAANAVIITRTGTGASTTGRHLSLSAVPAFVNAGEAAVVIATVTDSSSSPVSGVPVAFSLAANNSGGTFIAPAIAVTVNATTDVNGTALAVYVAGNNQAGISVQDVVQATIADSASAVIISRLTGAGTGNRLTLAEDPETGPGRLPTTSSPCVLTATVTRDDGFTPVEDLEVSFTIVVGGGTLETLDGDTMAVVTAETDTNGHASAIFIGPGGPANGETVIRASSAEATAARIVYW
jgi:hypothetical protein